MARPANPKAQSHARTVLVDAALELLERDGIERLTMRELARAAGVSHQTPNHHFGSKEGLLGDIAARGFAELDRAIADAAASASDDPRDQLLASAMGCVLFALRRPTLFRLLRRPGPEGRSPALTDAHAAVVHRFAAAFARFHDAPIDDPEVRVDTALALAAVHGICAEVIDPIAAVPDPAAHARAVVTRLFAALPPSAGSRADRAARRKA